MDLKTARAKGFRKVGEVAELFGTTPRTLLYYEELGILSPLKSPRGTRMYSESDIKRFDVAYRMSCLGVPVKTVRDLALARDSSKTGEEATRKLCAILDGLIEEISRQLRHLGYLKQDLERGRNVIRQCSCNKPSAPNCAACADGSRLGSSQLLWLTHHIDQSAATEEAGRPKGGTRQRGREIQGTVRARRAKPARRAKQA